MDRDDFQKEAEYFDKVKNLIQSRMKKLQDRKASLKEQVVKERKDMWDENKHLIRDPDEIVLLSSQDASVAFAEAQYGRNELEIQRLAKMEQSPYFGRIVFEESETGEKNTVYIGISGLTDEASCEIYIVDWRAPIASMFYNFDLGPAWYEVRGYREETRLTGKRQYKIEGGLLLSMYDTDSSMYDDILGEVLSGHSDHKLKVIISSIQKEQNLAIRSDTKRSCLIYGLAGSGKTSIGLHRLAYVLYNGSLQHSPLPRTDSRAADRSVKDGMKSENILILSNNGIFASYISAILPDLGEQPAKTKVFADLMEAALGQDIAFEDYYSQLKFIENYPDSERTKRIRIRYSAELLQYCIDYFASFSFRVPEIRYKDELIVSPECLLDRLNAGRLPTFKSRREMLEYQIKKLIEDFFRQHKEEIQSDIVESHDEVLLTEEVNELYRQALVDCLQSAQERLIRLNRLDPRAQTAELLSSYLRRSEENKEETAQSSRLCQAGGNADEAADLSQAFRRGKLLYEDALFYFLVRVLMGETAPFPGIRHTVIDESQDYTPLQLYIVKCLFPKSSFTLLGDIYQTVNSLTTMRRYEDYETIFGDGLMKIRLGKCYRSSSDINALAFRLIDEPGRPVTEEYSYFDRSVRKPQYVICRDPFSCLVPILKGLEKYTSIAVIVNGDEDALAVKSRLQEYGQAQLILSPDDELKGRLVILPLLLAKGLEFDAVILFHCIYANEKSAHLRRKIYLGCTRALHELYFVEPDALPDSLQECEPYLEFQNI